MARHDHKQVLPSLLPLLHLKLTHIHPTPTHNQPWLSHQQLSWAWRAESLRRCCLRRLWIMSHVEVRPDSTTLVCPSPPPVPASHDVICQKAYDLHSQSAFIIERHLYILHVGLSRAAESTQQSKSCPPFPSPAAPLTHCPYPSAYMHDRTKRLPSQGSLGRL